MKQPIPEQVFTQETFPSRSRIDIDRAETSILIESGYASTDGIKRFEHSLTKAVGRGVRICFFVEQPQDWTMREDPTLNPYRRAELDKLAVVKRYAENLGVHFNLRLGTHLKLGVVDYRVAWGGTANFLSYTSKKDEEVYRWTVREWALDIIKRRRLDQCADCLQLLETEKKQFSLEPATIGSQISEAREAKSLTQEQLALVSDLSRATISNIESGITCPGSDSLIRIFEGLDRKLLIVPADSAAILERWLNVSWYGNSKR